MMRPTARWLYVLGVLALAACSEGGGARPAAPPTPVEATPVTPPPSADHSAAPPPNPGGVTNPSGMPGGDQDAHGCKPSAGYQWCTKENRCVRSWELAAAKHFDNTPAGFHDYCEK